MRRKQGEVQRARRLPSASRNWKAEWGDQSVIGEGEDTGPVSAHQRTSLADWANFSVASVSGYSDKAGLTQATMLVRALPPRLSFSSVVCTQDSGMGVNRSGNRDGSESSSHSISVGYIVCAAHEASAGHDSASTHQLGVSVRHVACLALAHVHQGGNDACEG